MTQKSAPGRGELAVPAASGGGRGRVAAMLLMTLLAAGAVTYVVMQDVPVDPRLVLWGGAALAAVGGLCGYCIQFGPHAAATSAVTLLVMTMIAVVDLRQAC